MRVKYLQALLSQDIGFYDTDSTTGEIVVGISSDTLLVQDAIGEKVQQVFSYGLFSGYTCLFAAIVATLVFDRWRHR
jgi:ATP-binding cassette subfamily B (MDR/TAP) protein 1